MIKAGLGRLSLSISTFQMASRRSARLSAVSGNREATPSLSNTPQPSRSKRKAVTAEQISTVDKDGFTIPSTPKRKKGPKAVPPSTPTPTAAKLIGELHRADSNEAAMPFNKTVDPHLTNAPLVSPQTSRRVEISDSKLPSRSRPDDPLSISKTGDVLKKACAHLIQVEPRMKPLIEKHHCVIFSPEGLAEECNPFKALASSIISQQVSGAAAKSIKAKFVALFNPESSGSSNHAFPTPSQVAAKDIATLRTAGLSERKAEYIKGLAEKFASQELSTSMLLEASDEELFEKLIAVRGLGKWTVEMFACFGLKRMDVFSTGDLGVQRGLAAFVGKDVSKLKAKGGGKWKYISEKEMLDISAKFAPYRSAFMWYMWRVEEVDISTLEN